MILYLLALIFRPHTLRNDEAREATLDDWETTTKKEQFA